MFLCCIAFLFVLKDSASQHSHTHTRTPSLQIWLPVNASDFQRPGGMKWRLWTGARFWVSDLAFSFSSWRRLFCFLSRSISVPGSMANKTKEVLKGPKHFFHVDRMTKKVCLWSLAVFVTMSWYHITLMTSHCEWKKVKGGGTEKKIKGCRWKDAM